MQGKVNWGRVLLSGASMAAVSTGVAYAQDDVSDEIVVTATGRAAAIQDVPLAVTAVSGEAVQNAGIEDLRDIEQLAPSYRFFTGQSNTAGTTAYIRGFGTGGDNPGYESAVGFFIDGVYRNRSGVALSELPEVERIEVLRGPQGTLFGRNTSAGAISVVTSGPEFETHAWLSGTVGDYELTSGVAGVTGPIIQDVLAGRLDIGATAREGYLTDVLNDRDINAKDRAYARGQLLWDITPSASLRFIADASQTDEDCCAAVTLVAGSTSQIMNAIVPGAVIVPPNPEERNLAVSPNRTYREAVDEWGVSAQLDVDMGFANLTSITAYRDWEALRDQDIDFSGIDRAYRDDYEVGFETVTQEIRLQGEAGRIDWLVGLFYAQEDATLTDTIRFGQHAGAYVDILTSASTGGAQLHGTFPMSSTAILTGVPGARPNLVGAAFLQSATGQASVPAAFAFAAVNAPQLLTVYDGIANAFLAAYPQAGSGQVADRWATDTTSGSVFTHNEISLTDALTLTLGARFNHEEKDLSADLNSISPTCNVMQSQTPVAPGPFPSISQIIQGIVAAQPAAAQIFLLGCNPVVNTVMNGDSSDTHEEDEWSGTASLAFDVTDDMMVYAGYSRGYKAGGYNLDRSGFTLSPYLPVPGTTDDLEFNPEFVDAYELGWKLSTFSGGLTFNGAIFLEQITDFQLLAFTGFNFATFTVPDVVSKGVEVDFNARLGDNFNWQGGVVYLDAYYDTDIVVGGFPLEAGTPLVHAPEWTVSSAITYEQPLGNGLALLGYLDGRWNSEYRVQTLNRNPLTDNDAYAILNMRLGIGAEDQRWAVQAFVRNLTDEFYHIGAFGVPEQNNFAVYPSEPRTWGLTVRARY